MSESDEVYVPPYVDRQEEISQIKEQLENVQRAMDGLDSKNMYNTLKQSNLLLQTYLDLLQKRIILTD